MRMTLEPVKNLNAPENSDSEGFHLGWGGGWGSVKSGVMESIRVSSFSLPVPHILSKLLLEPWKPSHLTPPTNTGQESPTYLWEVEKEKEEEHYGLDDRPGDLVFLQNKPHLGQRWQLCGSRGRAQPSFCLVRTTMSSQPALCSWMHPPTQD